jgi:hypothetical protein
MRSSPSRRRGAQLGLLATLASAALVVALGAGVSVAGAAGPGGYVCTGGVIPANTYSSLTVTGHCMFGGDVTVNGNVRVADGAVLNDHAFSLANHVLITGNVTVGKGAVLGLGTYNPGATHDTTVNGNIVANQPLTLYLSFTTVHGNVVSNGGGSATEFRNFPTKDNVIDGNLIVQGWQGGWLGVIRDRVGGNVIVSNNASVVVETPEGCNPEDPSNLCTGSAPGLDPDSTEVQTNVIGGNLICQHNLPAAQVNALDGGQPNQVAGKAIGECAGLTDS